MGRVFAGTLKSPDLGRGITSAIFHDRAKVPVANDLLNKCVIIGSIAGRLSFKTLDVIRAVTKSREPGILPSYYKSRPRLL